MRWNVAALNALLALCCVFLEHLWQATGAGFLQPYGFALLSEAYWRTRQTDEGLAALSEAFALVETKGEQLWEAELYRLKGELLLQSQK